MSDRFLSKFNIRSMVFMSFTLASVTVELILSAFLWSKFTSQINRNLEQEKQIILSQINQTLDLYVRNMMKVADALYYNVIKNADISGADRTDINEQMGLLLHANKDYIFNIALFSKQGDLIASYPAGKIKENVNIIDEPWFRSSLSKTENVHFFPPAIQNIFLETEDQYHWIISLAHSAELTRGRRAEQGVLLINTRYEGVKQIFNNARIGSDGYVYLTDASGKIIFHPKMQLINSGLVLESSAQKTDGSYEENFNGERRVVTVKTSGYTGWKIIGVTKYATFSLNNLENNLFFILLFSVFVYVISIINLYISSKITDPIQKLEKSVLALRLELDENKIYSGGSNEVQSLSVSVKSLVAQMKKLMDDIVKEQEAKRKYELDVLQSQINPHFLYNTLDVIVWMVENEKRSEAVSVVTALARLFRVSLSEGKSIIPLADEIKHIENYLTIQKTRYKNKFTYSIEADPETLKYSTLKLIIQPIVENAIYHGMEFLEGEGEIKIRAFLDGDLFIEISDNGYGMTREEVQNLLNGSVKSKRGSGIGLKNIAERIKIYFGKGYGLSVVSAPDEGTKVTIKLPAALY